MQISENLHSVENKWQQTDVNAQNQMIIWQIHFYQVS